MRGSKNYGFDQWMLDHGYAAVDFHEVGDLSAATDLPSMRALLAAAMPVNSDKTIGNYAAQLNAFANRLSVSDV